MYTKDVEPMELLAVIVYGVGSEAVVGVPEMKPFVLEIVRPGGREGAENTTLVPVTLGVAEVKTDPITRTAAVCVP